MTVLVRNTGLLNKLAVAAALVLTASLRAAQ